MIILAVYYTLADIVLIIQWGFYNHQEEMVDVSHLSPATPLLQDEHDHHHHTHSDPNEETNQPQIDYGAVHAQVESGRNEEDDFLSDETASEILEPVPLWKTILLNTILVFLVFLAGIVGWAFSNQSQPKKPHIPENDTPLEFNFMGQLFGWLCAVLYLGSRIPQILLNFKRKSCEGISFLFFLFACLGNITFVISIISKSVSKQYLLINASWLAGSIGTLLLDELIFFQFWIYSCDDEDSDSDSDSSDSVESCPT